MLPSHRSLSAVAVATSILLISLVLVTPSDASPLEALLTEYLESGGDTIRAGPADADYDLHYDQRQTGSENYRLSIDGVMMAVPAASETTLGSLSSLASNYLIDLAAAAGESDGDDEDGMYGGGYGEEDADTVIEEEEEELQVDGDDPAPAIVAAADQHAKHPVAEMESKRRTGAIGLSRGASADAASAVSPSNNKVRQRPAFVQQSRTHPGPAKKRNKHKLRLSSIIEYLQQRRNNKN